MKRYSVAFEIIIALIVILLIVGVGLPQFNKAKDIAKDDEAKLCMHEIQIAIEMYGVDHKGTYPEHLIGGDRINTLSSQKSTHAGSVTAQQDVPVFLPDPLLRNGYLAEYPSNPYVNKKSASEIADLQTDVGDPMRTDASAGERSGAVGNRFGTGCTLMGNVSCDYRYPKTEIAKNKKVMNYPTHADFDGYLFYDVWQGDEPKMNIPGEFVYKSIGYPDRSKMDLWTMDVEPVLPIKPEDYVLCAYGSSRLKGMDVLGEEFDFRTYPCMDDDDRWLYEKYGNISGGGMTLFIVSWTRWYNEKDEHGKYPGSPFSDITVSLEGFNFGNPNGIGDSILILLCSGNPRYERERGER